MPASSRAPAPALLTLLLAAAASSAAAQTPGRGRCPVDGTQLSAASAPWNLGCGEDSDGCGYALDAEGRRRVVGLDLVVLCPTCRAAFRRDHLGVTLSAEHREAVRLAAAAAWKGFAARPGPDLPQARACELAAVTYLALAPEAFGLEEEPAAVAGRLLLRAAWAVRGRAVLDGPDGGYRPRSLADQRARLEALEQRVARDPRRSEEVKRIDAALAEVEEARLALRAAGSGTLAPEARLSLLRAVGALQRLERDLLEQRERRLARAREGAGPSVFELELALCRARIRAGEGPRADRSLAELAARHPEQRAPGELRALIAEEARLLQRAEEALLAALGRNPPPPRRAELSYLAGDLARRLGRAEEAKARLRAAAALAPGSEVARRAALLLEE